MLVRASLSTRTKKGLMRGTGSGELHWLPVCARGVCGGRNEAPVKQRMKAASAY